MGMSTVKIPLLLREYEKQAVDKRFIAHGLLYNSVLSELFKRIEVYHKDPVHLLPFSKKNNITKIKLRYKLKLSKFETMKIGNRAWSESGNALLDGKTVESTSQRAWVHVQDYLKYKVNKPRFKNPYNLKTVSANGNKQNLRLSNKSLNNESLEQVSLLWSNRGLDKKKHLNLRIDWYQQSGVRREWLINNYHKIKHVSITKELIRGEWKYYMILTLNCPAYRSELTSAPEGTLAIDTGPSQSKGVDQEGNVISFQPTVEKKLNFKQVEKLIKRKQRRLERSLRTNNPDCYEKDGTLKKGSKLTNWSKNAKQLRNDLHELHRKRRALQKENTVKQVKSIVKKYKTVVLENVSYKAWFSRYSKSMKLFTPGLFQSLLDKELTARNGKLVKLPLCYAFSQTCYCGSKKKKDLSERTHSCDNKDCIVNNKTYNRDVFSAALMLMVHENKIPFKTYQSHHHDGPGYGYLPVKARTTIEMRLDLLSNNTSSSYSKPTTIYDDDDPKKSQVHAFIS